MRRAASRAAAAAPLISARPAIPPAAAAAGAPTAFRNLCASTSAGAPAASGSSRGRRRQAFSSSARSHAEASGSAGQSSSTSSGSSSSGPPPPQHGRSPWAAFKETLKAELEKSREWQDTAKQLGGEVGKVQDSAAMRRAREMYERARLIEAIKSNPTLVREAARLKRLGIDVGSVVSETVRESQITRGIYAGARVLGDAAAFATAPVRNTEAYKAVASSVTDALDEMNANVRYGGYVDREARRKRHEARLKALGRAGLATVSARMPENLEAGQNISLHATANAEASSGQLETVTAPVRRLMGRFSEAYQESENPVVSTMRSVTSTVGRWFDETEESRAIKEMRIMDPSFEREGFLRLVRDYMVPEIIDAYTSGDFATLREWLSEGAFATLTSVLKPHLEAGLIPDCQILDIREVDFASVRMLDDQIPVFVVSARTQETEVFRDPVTHDVKAGNPSGISQIGYVFIFRREEEEMGNDLTGGWRVIDAARRGGAGGI